MQPIVSYGCKPCYSPVKEEKTLKERHGNVSKYVDIWEMSG